jgi:signal transduction histidine kinase/CHASE3 domain sensor protein
MNLARAYGLNRSIGGAIVAIAIVSLLSGISVMLTMRQVEDAVARMDRSNRIVRELDAFKTAMLNQETGARGFLLTGRKESLEPYQLGRSQLEVALQYLHELIGDDQRLLDAEAAARDWQRDFGNVVAKSVEDPAMADNARALAAAGAGKSRFDRLRNRLGAIEKEQDQEHARQTAAVARANRNANIALSVGLVLVLLICASIGVAVSRIIVKPLVELAGVMGRLASGDVDVEVPGTGRRDEVGGMARAVAVFKTSMIELDRTSVLRATADTLPALVGYIDVRRRIGFLNSEFERWFDLPENADDSWGRPLADVFTARPFPGVNTELATALAGTEVRFDYPMLRDGEHRDLQARYRPHLAAGGQVLGAVTLLTDITERKEMELRLANQARDLLRSNEELEQFAYVASHDLKAPLRGIDNLVTWIEEDLGDAVTGEVRTNMDLLRSRVRRLEALLDDLLAYSRAGRGELTRDAVDAGELVQELAELVSPPEGFSIKAVGALPTLRTSRAPLTQVLQNLIANAIKHHDHPASGHIWIEAAEQGVFTEFVVSDDGPGIPEQYRERVFGMFQTLKPRDEVEGSGMGLAIVKKLVERQRGTIWLTDSPRGRGLAVHFTWPRR